MKKTWILILCVSLSLSCFGENFPYPKIQKIYTQGKYDICLEKISQKLERANAKQKFWLYCLEMRCYATEYNQKPSVILVKKAFNSGKRMMYKHQEELSEYPLLALQEFYDVLAKANENINPKDKSLVKGFYLNLFNTFKHPYAAWEMYNYYVNENETYNANAALKEGIDADVALYRKGIHTLFVKGHLAWLRLNLEQGYAQKAESAFTTGRELYANLDSFCILSETIFLLNIAKFSSEYSSPEIEVYHFLDALKQAGCSQSKQLYIGWKSTLLQKYILEKNVEKSINTAEWMFENYPDKFDTSFFISEFLNNIGANPSESDSIRLLLVFQISAYTQTEEKLKLLKQLILTMGEKGEFIRANSIVSLGIRFFPKEIKFMETMQKAMKKSLLEYLAHSNMLSRESIMAYYNLSPKNAETKRQFVNYIEKYVNIKLTQKNYSECFRILKYGFRIFPKNETFIKLQKTYAMFDYEDHYIKNKSLYTAKIENLNVATCTAGKVEDNYQIVFLEMLNYFRRTAGVYDSVTLDKELNNKAQWAALIMHANNSLTHGPSEVAKCYTKAGAMGAGSSNLSLGHNGINALIGQLDDDGGNNSSVGHRRWILNPTKLTFGHGSSPNSMALYVFGRTNYGNADKTTEVFNDTLDFVAWPAQGAFPAALVPKRWSFSFSQANFDSCEIIAKFNGKSLPVAIESRNGGYALPTIVWTLDGDFRGKEIYIEVKKVGCTKPGTYNTRINKTFKYQVSLF